MEASKETIHAILARVKETIDFHRAQSAARQIYEHIVGQQTPVADEARQEAIINIQKAIHMEYFQEGFQAGFTKAAVEMQERRMCAGNWCMPRFSGEEVLSFTGEVMSEVMVKVKASLVLASIIVGVILLHAVVLGFAVWSANKLEQGKKTRSKTLRDGGKETKNGARTTIKDDALESLANQEYSLHVFMVICGVYERCEAGLFGLTEKIREKVIAWYTDHKKDQKKRARQRERLEQMSKEDFEVYIATGVITLPDGSKEKAVGQLLPPTFDSCFFYCGLLGQFVGVFRKGAHSLVPIIMIVFSVAFYLSCSYFFTGSLNILNPWSREHARKWRADKKKEAEKKRVADKKREAAKTKWDSRITDAELEEVRAKIGVEQELIAGRKLRDSAQEAFARSQIARLRLERWAEKMLDETWDMVQDFEPEEVKREMVVKSRTTKS
jgi:hypothetical protein